ARIQASEASAAAFLRLRPGIEALELGDALWLRGNDLDESLELALRSVPGAILYSMLPGGLLRRKERRIPEGKAPEGSWLLLARSIAADPQPAALAAEAPDHVTLKLVRGSDEKEPTVLLTTAASWAAYASEAPLVRLKPLAFAAAEDGRVVIKGRPLPPIPG